MSDFVAIAEASATVAPARSCWSHPAFLSSASALFLWFAFPPADRGYLAWIALAPFFSLVRSDRRWWKDLLASWLGGWIFGALAISWVSQVDVIGCSLLALYMSLWWPLFLVPARLGVKRLGLPLMVVAPVVWVGLEYARSLIVSGFPWYYLAHTQYANLNMIQVSDLFGAWGLSLLVAMGNVLFLDLLTLPLFQTIDSRSRGVASQKRKIAVVVGLVLGAQIYGAVRLATSRFRPGPRLALIQTDISQEDKNHPRGADLMVMLDRLLDRAARSEPRPDLIVWPETSYPVGRVLIDPSLPDAEFARLARRFDPESTPNDWLDRKTRGDEELRRVTEGLGIPMVVGLATYDFTRSNFDRYNSAALFLPGIPAIATYHKQVLVPVGEYFPFLDILPWLIKLTPYTDGYVPSLTPGPGPRSFEVGGVRYAPIICFEDTIPSVARRAVLDPAGHADILLNLTNDGWFRGSSEQPAHLAICVFRAVECRRPLARAVNTGISAVVNGNGQILASLPQSTDGVLTAEVPLDGRASLYLVVGDVLGILCMVATIGLIPVAAFYPRQSPTLAQGASVG
jgi:apolipoprotein N-acyltransferase